MISPLPRTIEASSARSMHTEAAWWPAEISVAACLLAPASSRSAMTTVAPDSAKTAAMPVPMPLAPPVTTATLPLRSNGLTGRSVTTAASVAVPRVAPESAAVARRAQSSASAAAKIFEGPPGEPCARLEWVANRSRSTGPASTLGHSRPYPASSARQDPAPRRRCAARRPRLLSPGSRSSCSGCYTNRWSHKARSSESLTGMRTSRAPWPRRSRLRHRAARRRPRSRTDRSNRPAGRYRRSSRC